MPGAPHMGPGKPMSERTTAEIIGLFIVAPVLAGVAIVCFAVWNAAARGREFTVADWVCQVGWFGLLGLAVMLGLPAAGWQELRRRCKPRSGDGRGA
jgi:hypothetical protein